MIGIKSKEKLVNMTDIERFNPDIEQGLTTEQVELRRSQKLVNVIKNKNSKTYANIFISNILTYFNLICLLVLTALLIVKARLGNLMFIFVILTNVLIGIIQEIRAKRAVEKLKLLSEPQANVVRNGEYKDISIKDIVLDDILIFSAGKQISTDCVIISGNVEVNESLLTGESELVTKSAGDILYSGSFIAVGSCYAKADKVGNNNYIARLSDKAKKYKKPDSEIMRTLRNMIKVIGFILPVLILLVFWSNNRFYSDDLALFVIKTSGAIIGLIPAGLFLLSSIALAIGATRLAKNKCLVQDTHCIEMLARVNVLCLDKTGTITDGKMSVTDFIILKKETVSAAKIIGNMLQALPDNNQTSVALKEKFKMSQTLAPVNVFPFSSVKKMSAVTFKKIGTYAIGAPEFVLNNIDEELKLKINEHAKNGLRVLILAHSENYNTDEDVKKDMIPVALILLSDNIRKDAIETIRWFKDNKVEIKVISGDNAVTVSEVSKRAGIENAENYISLDTLSIPEIIEAAVKYTVFGRVTPDQKAILIKALKTSGYTVAMTGDGVNDILAMKESDCSISIASGSEAARSISHLVLMNSDFSPMPMVVAEGRKVVNNLQKSSSLYLVKTFYIAMLCLWVCITRSGYPFSPGQMLPLEMGVIGFSSFILALENNTEPIKGDFLLTTISNAIPAAFIMLINYIALFILEKFFNIHFETLSVLSMSIVGVLYLARLCMPYNLRRLILVIFVSTGMFLGFLFLPNFIDLKFTLQELSFLDLMLLGVMSFISFFILKILMSKKFKVLTLYLLAKIKIFFVWLSNIFKNLIKKLNRKKSE